MNSEMTSGSYFMILFIVSRVLISKSLNVSWELQLKSHLLDPERYDATSRPRFNFSQHVLVNFSWTVIRIIKVPDITILYAERDVKSHSSIHKNLQDELGGAMTQLAIIELTWSDDFLTWNPNEYGGIEEFIIPGNRIWTPEVNIGNRIEGQLLNNGLKNELLRVNKDGKISALSSGHLTTTCDIAPELFPFDCQVCYIILKSWMHKESEIKFLADALPLRLFHSDMNDRDSFWNIVNYYEETLSSLLGRDENTGYILNFTLQRKSTFYSFIIIWPSAILSLLTLATYLIPVEEGERISYGIALILADVVFLMKMSDTLPPVSNRQYPILGVYFLILLTTSLIATVNSIVVVFLTRCKPATIQPDGMTNAYAEKQISRGKFKETDTLDNPSSTRTNNICTSISKRISIITFTLCLLSTLSANLLFIYPSVTPCV